MEQRLIDANDLKKYVYRIDDSASLATRDVVNEEDIDDALTVLTIPNNATNGDIIKALFPYVNVKDTNTMYYSVNIEDLSSDEELNTVGFRKDWWNAPWKG